MIHVYPLNDEQEHILFGTMCWCDPTPDTKDPAMMIHNSEDCREIIEQSEEIKNSAK